MLEASDEFSRSSLYFFQELDVFGAVRVPGGSGILEVGANKGGVQCTEGLYIPGINTLFQLTEYGIGFVGRDHALVVPFEVIGNVDTEVSFYGCA